MALYVTLYNFTDQGIRNVKDSPSRLKAAIDKAEGVGMKVLGAYYTQGPYDLVVVSEVENEDAAAAFTLGTGALGNVRSLSMKAWDPDGFSKIVSMIP
jgi:uncharacterized protein with GYD domain